MTSPRRGSYNLTHSTVNVGKIGCMIPFMHMEVVPGDTWSGKIGQLIRLEPLKKPLMLDLYVDQYLFYVPHRLVWDEFEDFLAAGPDPLVPVTPPALAPATAVPSLWLNDDSGTLTHSALRLRAMNLVYNEYFRDQEAPVVGADDLPPSSNKDCWAVSPKRQYLNEMRERLNPLLGQNAIGFQDVPAAGQTSTSADAILRAVQKHKIDLKRQTYGTRYVDILRSYGIKVNYQMLQRPEVVASAHDSINVTDVVSSSQADPGPGENALGQTAGHGIGGQRLSLRRKSFPEHGTLIGFVIVRPPFADSTLLDYYDRPRDFNGYWDPGLEHMPPTDYLVRDFYTGDNNTDNVVGQLPYFHWLRGSMNRVHKNATIWQPEHFAGNAPGTPDLADLRTMYPSNFDDLFNLTPGTDIGHMTIGTVNKLRALRLVGSEKKSTIGLGA